MTNVSINGTDRVSIKAVKSSVACSGGTTATPLTQNPEPERRELRVGGQVWWLLKRSSDPDAKFHLQGPMHKGKRFRQALQFSSVKDAEAEAKPLIKKWIDGWRNPAKPKAPLCATVAELESAFPLLTIKASQRTRADYLSNLRRCLVHALDPVPADLSSVRLDALTDQAGARMFAWVEKAALAETGQAAQNRLRGSWLSMFLQSLAIFAKRSTYQLKARGLVLPDLTGWREAALHHGPRLPRRAGAAVPDDETCRRMRLEWLRLGLTPGYVCRNFSERVTKNGHHCEAGPLSELARRNMFLALGLELSCGLRVSEVAKAKWGWVKRFSGVPHLSELDVDVKNSTGQIHVVPVDPYWRVMLWVAKRNGWVGAADEPFMIEPAKTDGRHPRLVFSIGGPVHATIYPFEHISFWLRDLGWDMQKTNHALRDYTGSVITMRYGLSDACDWCRHSTLETTRKSYNRFVTLSGKINKQRYAWLKWAQ